MITELPRATNLILGSDWRPVANDDVTFDTTNDVTVVAVEPTEKVPSPEGSHTKRSTGHCKEEALIAFFCRQTNKCALEDNGFVRLDTMCPTPDNGFTQLVEGAVRKLTKDASDA